MITITITITITIKITAYSVFLSIWVLFSLLTNAFLCGFGNQKIMANNSTQIDKNTEYAVKIKRKRKRK
jgi:hypothetical protein